MKKNISLKIKLEIAKYILLGVAKYKNIRTPSKKKKILGSQGYPSLILPFAPAPESIEIMTRKLILEANVGIHHCRKLYDEVGKVDITVDDDESVDTVYVGIAVSIRQL